jgi:hypothetical protein
VARPQRLLFGEGADLYDRHRPSYPAALVDDLLARAGLEHGGRAIEVGAGTGKATELRAALSAAYRRYAPDMPADSPLHPDNPSPQGEDDWPAEIAAVPEFSAPEVQIYRWSQDYDARAYAALLNTLSDFQRLEAVRRVRLLDAVASAIADRGGILTMPLITRLHTAHAVGIR